MITAKEALFKSNNQQKIDAILEDLEDFISISAEKGKTKTSISIGLDTPKEVREYLYKYLTNLGYEVEISNNEELNRKMGSHSIDQGYYNDTIKVSWGVAK